MSDAKLGSARELDAVIYGVETCNQLVSVLSSSIMFFLSLKKRRPIM